MIVTAVVIAKKCAFCDMSNLDPFSDSSYLLIDHALGTGLAIKLYVPKTDDSQ